MANRYWVGGTGSWSDDENHWALTSGGAGGIGNLPTNAEDVVIDASSGFGSGGTITLDAAPFFKDFTSTSGHIYTITGSSQAISVYGSLTLEAGITIEPSQIIYFEALSAVNITTAGVSLPNLIWGYTDGSTGVYTLLDDLTTPLEIQIYNGTIDANGFDITANSYYFYSANGWTPNLTMGSGTWEVTGGNWWVDEYESQTVDFTPETSTIKLTGVNQDFYGAGKTYGNIWFSGSGTKTITGVNTFIDLKIDIALTVKFTEGTTTTVSTFTAIGTIGNLITLDSVNGSDQFDLSKTSGIVVCDYLDISNSNATGGATWYAGANSNDTANNDGWIFTGEPTPPSTMTGVTEMTSVGLIVFGSLPM